MHVLGKVLLVFALLGAAGAIYLSSQMLAVRNAWVKQVVDLEKTALDNQTKLDGLEEQKAALDKEITQLQLAWDQQWADPNLVIQVTNVQSGELSSNLGKIAGLGTPTQNASQLPIVYLFNVDNTGKSRYIGAFQVTSLLDNASTMRAIHTPFVNTAAQDGSYKWNPELLSSAWPQGGIWRVRMMVPTGYTTRFADMNFTLRIDQEEWNRETSTHAALQNNLDLSADLRDLWIAEMVGRSYLPQDQQLTPEEQEHLPFLQSGYLLAIDEQETAQNEVLLEVDQLRREVQHANQQIDLLTKENGEFAQKLPQPTEPATPTEPTQAAKTP